MSVISLVDKKPAVRKPLSKKMRFDVFKRDAFTCQYCGRTPPEVVLEADHVVPVAKGGLTVIDNLLTACHDCNNGKRDGLLEDKPQSLVDKAAFAAEREAQLRAYERVLNGARKREDEAIDAIEATMAQRFPEIYFSPATRATIRTRFLTKFTRQTLCDFMAVACGRVSEPRAAYRYFCGICWRTIKDRAEWR